MATLLAALTLLVSCDKKREAQPSKSAQDSRRSTQTGRLSRHVPSRLDNLRSAFEKAKAMAPGEERESALGVIARSIIDTTPDIASQVIAAMAAGGDEKKSLIEAYIQKLMGEGNTNAAVSWADSLGDENDIATARAMIAQLLAVTNPKQAAAMLPASSFTAGGVDPAAEQILQNWVATDPTEASAWVSRMPAGEVRSAGLKTLLATWIVVDSGTAFSWVALQRNSSIRQEAVDAVVMLLVGQPDSIRNYQLESANKDFQKEIAHRIAELTQDPELESESKIPVGPGSSISTLPQQQVPTELDPKLESEP